MSTETHFVFAKILDPVGPLVRGEKYEDPLQSALDAESLGEITGGGTLMDKSHNILSVGIDIEVTDLQRALPLIARTLAALGAPPGSDLQYTLDGQKITHPIRAAEEN